MKLGPETDLGLKGINTVTAPPPNYGDENVLDEIINNNDANGDGKCDLEMIIHKCVLLAGENHLGYWGFRDTSRHLVNDGAMNLVVTMIQIGPTIYIYGDSFR